MYIPVHVENTLKAIIRGAYTEPWADMTYERQVAWAELLLECPDCKRRRGEQCAALPVDPERKHPCHLNRRRQARAWYEEWRDRIINEEARTICPWCGYWFRDEAEERAHEELCDA